MDFSLHNIIILLACVALVCSAAAGVLISYTETNRKRFDLRMASVGSLSAAARSPTVMRRIARAAPRQPTLLERAAGVFGIDLQRVKFCSSAPASAPG